MLVLHQQISRQAVRGRPGIQPPLRGLGLLWPSRSRQNILKGAHQGGHRLRAGALLATYLQLQCSGGGGGGEWRWSSGGGAVGQQQPRALRLE